MPTEYTPQNNATLIAAAAKAIGTNNYGQGIPDVTQVGVAGVQRFLFSPMNRQYLNAFSNFLVNRIGAHYIRSKTFENPLAFLKNEKIEYGETVQETAFKWLKGHSFNSDDIATQTILKTHYPEGASAYHSQNRQDKYIISTNWKELKTAFTNEKGLSDYVAAVYTLPRNRDNYDEFQIMKQLMAEFHRDHGIFSVNVTAPTDENSAREFLRVLREWAGNLRFPSTAYNALDVCDIPVWAEPDELILFVTPRVRSWIDVFGLAPIFGPEYAQPPYSRVVEVDSFPMQNTEAIIAPRDWYMVNDTVYEPRQWENPESLTLTHWLHHWGVYSLSPFVPVIRLTTEEGTVIPDIVQEVTGLEVTARPFVYMNTKDTTPVLTVNLLGTVAGETDCCLDPAAVKPDTATFVVKSVKNSDNEEMAWTESQIQIHNNGEVYVNAHGNSALAKAVKAGGVTVTVEGLATYINPTGVTQDFTAEAEFRVLCAPEED